MSEPGAEVMARFLGSGNVDRSRDYLEQLDPELHRYIMDFVYGEVYAGDALDPKTRALCTVAMLACLDQQLQLGVIAELRLCDSHEQHPPIGIDITRRKTKRLQNVSFGFLAATDKILGHADTTVGVGQVWVPKVGWVRFRWSRAVPPNVKSYRIRLDRAGRWHIAFPAIPDPLPAPGNGEAVGVDRGVMASAALSTGTSSRRTSLSASTASRS